MKEKEFKAIESMKEEFKAIENMKEEFEVFECMVRKNAKLISDFCNSTGMSPVEAGASAEFFGACVKEALMAAASETLEVIPKTKDEGDLP